MAVSYTTALQRSEVQARAAARRADRQDAALIAVALVAVLAIASAAGGRRTAFEVTEQRRGGAPPIDLHGVTGAAQLDPALRLLFAEPADRAFAARHLLLFLREQREAGRTLPNVGAILGIEVPAAAIENTPGLLAYGERLTPNRERVPLFTSGDLATLKPAFAIRTLDTFGRTLVTCVLVYLAAFAACALLWRSGRIRGDRMLLAIAHLLTAIGFAVIVSRPDPIRDSLLFVRYTEGIVVGLVVMSLAAAGNARRILLRDLSYLPLLAAFALSALLIVFGDGPGRSGAKVNLGPVQPIEAIRLLLALFLAGYFARRWELLRGVRGVEYVAPVIVGTAAAAAFFFLQRDLGPALLLACSFLGMYAVARGGAGLAMGGLAALAASFYVGYQLTLSETLAERVRMWLSPWDNSVRGGDQIAQATWALATGGPLGSGLGLGDTRYLPAGHTDLAIAAVGEELGVLGIVIIGGAFAALAWRGLQIARRATGDYEGFLAASLTLFLVVPALIMGAGMLGFMPLTGVVTPFLSYGGSAMTANLGALGLLSVIRTGPPTDDHEPLARPLRWLGGVFAVCGVILLLGFAHVQVLRADALAVRPHLSLQADGVRRYQHNPRVADVLRQLPRGTVYDRRGLPLATDDRAVLQRSREEYARFGVSTDTCVAGPERCYPLAGRTFHLLGDARTRLNWAATNSSYIERDAENRLRGLDSEEPAQFLPLVRHRYEPDHPDVQAFFTRNRDLRLTIDARLQARVATILAQAARRSATGRAAAVVLDPATGDLLASASYPWPDHASPSTRDASAAGDALLDRARYGLYPPGSTFKLLTAAAALRRDPAASGASFFCRRLPDGRVGARIPGHARPVRDDVRETHPHGRVDLRAAMVRSCNAYFAQLAVQLGPDALVDAAAPLGAGLGPASSPARLRDTLPQAGYGQGDVLTTPLRMARVAAAFAADGVVREASAIPAAARKAEPLLAPQPARLIARYLREAVLEGTGRSLRTHPGKIAGKTGTAETAGRASHAWFVGFAPYGPATRRIAFAVIVEHAGYGGLTAAPVAGEIVTAAAEAGLLR